MGKRKVEDKSDDDWNAAPKKASRAPRQSAPRAGATIAATHYVKSEPLEDDDVNPSIAATAGPSTLNTYGGSSQSPVKDGGPIPAVPHKPSKRVKKEVDADPPAEKRLARIRKSCPKNISDRMERVRAQRMFLVDRDRQGEALQEEFKVLGSTGNVYTVVIKHLPSCDCPDALKGNHCKHLIFVLLKVLGVSAESPNIYQKALLTSELQEIFANAPQTASASTHNSGLQKAWAEATGSPVKNRVEDQGGKKRLPEDGDTCPICFDEFEADMAAIVFCEASCGGPVHSVCIAQWLATKPEPTCIYCRAPWPKTGAAGVAGPAGRDGCYVNLAGAAGISAQRDTTTYYHGPQRGMSQAAAYYSAAARYNGGQFPRGGDYDYEEPWWE